MDITEIAKRLEEWGFRKEDIPKIAPLVKEVMGEETDSFLMVCRACQAVEQVYLGFKIPENLTHLNMGRTLYSEQFQWELEMFYESTDLLKKLME